MSLDLIAMGKYVDDSSSSSSSDSDSDDNSSNNSSSSSSSSSSSANSSAASSPASSPVVPAAARKSLTTAAGKVRLKPGPKPKAGPKPAPTPKPKARTQRAAAIAATARFEQDDDDFDNSPPPPPPPSSMPPPPPPPPLPAPEMGEKPKKKRAAPVKRAPSALAAKKKQKVQEELPPPPPPPASPPPPPPSDDSSSNSSSMESSDSSSSSDSDDFDETIPRRPSSTKSSSSSRVSPSSARSKAGVGASQSSPLAADALKVKLKLPPGFIAKHPDGAALKTTLTDRGKLKVQVTNSRPPAKKQKTPTPKAATKKATATASKAKAKSPSSKSTSASKKGKKGASPAAAPLAAPPGSLNGALNPVVPSLPVWQPILPKLIPKGPTLPVGEIRGRRELTLVGQEGDLERPDEVPESDLSVEFNDPFAVESDALRNLDLFFFCDEFGNAIGLEILEKPKHERPKIMGFGTVVQHLPPAERPLPVKYILPSPAFPSRNRKRPRSDSGTLGASPAGKPSKSGSNSAAKSTSKKSPSKQKTKSSANGSAVQENLPQLDGHDSGTDAYAPRPTIKRSGSIFNSVAIYESTTSRGVHKRSISQLDGLSDSDGSSVGSRSGRGSSRRGSDSEGELSVNESMSGSSASGSDTDSGNESDEHDKASTMSDSSSARLTAEPVVKSSPVPARGEDVVSPSKQQNDAQIKAHKKSLKTSSPQKHLTMNPDVDELMRTDREGFVKPRGTDDELNLLECGFRHPQEYKRARVWLPEISDWCLDYSEGDPTLWVITPHAWYKVAGPLSGMLPHPSYREKFRHVRKLFEASYLVAYVLKEWLPINKKVSYRSTLQQIVELSLKGRYPVSGWFLMENCQFIQNQICDLVADKEAYLDSMFFKQLQRMYEAHKAREERVRKEMAEREEKRMRREDEKMKKKQQQEEERRKLQDKKDEERKVKEAERRYPIEDSELLLEETDPAAQVLPVTPSPWMGLDGFLLGDMIVAWQTICTFKDFISLEPISLDALTACITSKDEGETDITLIRIFMAFLKVILSEKSFVSPMDDLVVEGSTTVADLFVNTQRTYGICERPYIELLNAVSWQDILRQLMAKDLDVDASIGRIEPLVGCEIVRQTLYMQNNSVPFNAPVDTKIKGLEDYLQVIKNPMDLGTVKQKMDAGLYEGENGHETFATDVRLIWENALFFNGEESEVGKAALALSDIFEQDYQRLVAGRIAANTAMLEASREVASVAAGDNQTRPRFFDIVHALYSFEFHQLPVPFKIGALAWTCSEFLKLDSVRSHIEAQAEREFEVNREFRRKAGEIDSRRKQFERNRREREAAFKRDCAERGIEPNANNHFSDTVKQEHPFIAKFYEEIRSEKAAEDAEWQTERKFLDDETRVALEGVIVRESPLGRDRFHNSYWVFKNDSKQRLFIEASESGEFIAVTEQTVLDGLLEWLNPKGIREFDLISKLKQISADLARDMAASSQPTSSSFWGSDHVLTLNLFPLPGEEVKSTDKLVISAKAHTPNAVVMRRMLSKLYDYAEVAKLLPPDWDSSKSWKSRVEASRTASTLRELFAEIEAAIFGSRGGAEMIRPTWKRKRREWRLSLEGSCTISQLVFLLHLFLAECINIEAFTDLSARLDRKEWFKLRSKECRNFIPEIGKNVIYFGDGHNQAVKEDAKGKKKRFTRKCDSPVLHTTLLCQVVDVSYYHGGGDPYALLTLRPQDKLEGSVTKNPPGTFLCPQPSPLQRLGRILQRVLAKLKLHADAGPFLEPVSDRDFPEYKEIIPHPMDLGKIATKARANQYRKADQFMSDIRLMSSNCALFCEGRFPSLPPLAENVVDMAEALVKKFHKELRVYEKAVSDGVEELHDEQPTRNGSKDRVKEGATSLSTPPLNEANDEKTKHTPVPGEVMVVLRLENRLPEYIIDVKRYEAAVTRTWRCGEKFKMLFRDPKGYPGEYYGGVAAGSLPFDTNGLLPWEALRVVWDEDDGSDSRINPWEAEMIPEGRKGR